MLALIKRTYFGLRKARRSWASNRSVFSEIYKKGLWDSEESASGLGSTMDTTAELRKYLPDFFKKYQIRSIVDAPCGDFHWMRTLDLEGIHYLGVDVVPELVQANSQKFGNPPHMRFECMDLTRAHLPKVDLIVCRDCLVHLSLAEAKKVLKAMVSSGSRYLMTTTYVTEAKNHDIAKGFWRPLNLTLAPFDLPEPIALIPECGEAERMTKAKHSDKAMGVWEISKLEHLLR